MILASSFHQTWKFRNSLLFAATTQATFSETLRESVARRNRTWTNVGWIARFSPTAFRPSRGVSLSSVLLENLVLSSSFVLLHLTVISLACITVEHPTTSLDTTYTNQDRINQQHYQNVFSSQVRGYRRRCGPAIVQRQQRTLGKAISG